MDLEEHFKYVCSCGFAVRSSSAYYSHPKTNLHYLRIKYKDRADDMTCQNCKYKFKSLPAYVSHFENKVCKKLFRCACGEFYHKHNINEHRNTQQHISYIEGCRSTMIEIF